MKRLAEDDVQTRCYRVQMSLVDRPGLAQRSVNSVRELTSRVSNRDIPKYLDQLEVKFKAAFDDESGKFVTQWDEGETRAIRCRARHEHAFGRRRREPARPDGRQRAAKGNGGIHPGHQPRRPFLSRAGLHCADMGGDRVTSRTTKLSSITTRHSTSTSKRSP